MVRAPGPWLRLTALAAAAALALAVASGELGLAHRVLAGLALPPLVALVIAAWTAYPRLRVPAAAALALFLVALASWWWRPLHVSLAVLSLASTLVAVAATYRGARVAAGPWRDYVTLTKPRIMSLLLLTGAAGMFVGEGGAPPLGDLAVLLVGL